MLRTALALMAAGIALLHLFDDPLDHAGGTALVVAGILVAATSSHRWRAVEAALRRADGGGPADLDPPPGPPVYREAAMGGGTSGSSPLLAALEADAMEATGHALGFVNPALYRLAGTAALRDVLPVDPADPPITAGIGYCGPGTDGSDVPCLTTLGLDGALKVTPGYDAVTGLGTPTSAFVTAFRTG